MKGQRKKDNLTVAYAQYAEGGGDVSIMGHFSFCVMIQCVNALERTAIANFQDKNDAKLFILGKCEADTYGNDTDLFFIFKDKQLIDTSNRIMLLHQKKEGERGKGEGNGASFQPTPFQTRPTPPGIARDCWVEKDDEAP